MPKDVEQTLAAWRRAEQRLAEVAEGSAEYIRAQVEAETWRRRYQALVNASGPAGEERQRSQTGLPEAG